MAAIRTARKDDFDWVAQMLALLEEAASGDPGAFVGPELRRDMKPIYDALIASNDAALLIAEEAGERLGLITVSYVTALRYGAPYAQIEEVVLTEGARGKGIGKSLLDAAVARAKDRGCVEIGLYAGERTRGFYESAGFADRGVELRKVIV